MWHGGEEFDEPGDFDEVEPRDASVGKEVDTAVVVKSSNIVNINLHEVIEKVNKGREEENSELLKVLKQLVRKEEGAETGDGDVSLKGQDEYSGEDERTRINSVENENTTRNEIVSWNTTMVRTSGDTGENSEETGTSYVIWIVLIVVGCAIICLIIFIIYLRYRRRRDRFKPGGRAKVGGGDSGSSHMLGRLKVMCCKEVGAVKNQGEETGYLTPIRRDTGAIPKSTVQSRASDVAAKVESSSKREVVTGIQNENFRDRPIGLKDDGLYEEVQEENAKKKEEFEMESSGQPKDTEQAGKEDGDRKESERSEQTGGEKEFQNQSSATFGIYTSGSMKIHTYVNVDHEEGSESDVIGAAGSEKKLEIQEEDRVKDHYPMYDEVYNSDNEIGESKFDEYSEEDDKNDGSLEWDSEIEWNNTVIPESFEQSVRDAIEQVDATRLEGEERLVRVLERLEEGMKVGISESEKNLTKQDAKEEDIPKRRKKKVTKQDAKEEDTPRRSNRIAELRLAEVEKN